MGREPDRVRKIARRKQSERQNENGVYQDDFRHRDDTHVRDKWCHAIKIMHEFMLSKASGALH